MWHAEKPPRLCPILFFIVLRMDFYCMLLCSCWCLEDMALLNQQGFSWASKGISPVCLPVLSTRTSIKSMEEWIQYLQREIEIWNSTALLVNTEKHITFASYSSKILQPAPVCVSDFLLTGLFFVLMELLGACKHCLPDPRRSFQTQQVPAPRAMSCW